MGVSLTYLKMQLKAMSEFRLNFLFATFSMITTNIIFQGAPLYLAYSYESFMTVSFEDVLMGFTIANIAYVLGANFFGGIRHLQKSIITGNLDKLLVRPISLYKHLLVAETNPYALGEIFTALIFLAFNDVSLWPLILLYSIPSAIILHCSILFYNLLGFFFTFNQPIRYFEMIIQFLFYPADPFRGVAKFIGLFILPGLMITFGPVFILGDPTFAFTYFGFMVGLMIVTTILFKLGVQKYQSAGY